MDSPPWTGRIPRPAILQRGRGAAGLVEKSSSSHSMATRLEVQVRYCFCCGITIGALLIALYTILVFSGLIALALWGVSRPEKVTSQYYHNCTQQAMAYNDQCQVREANTTRGTLETKLVICDASSYHCSLALYTEELKFASGYRHLANYINLIVWACLVVAALLVLVALCLDNEWLIIPWLIVMCVEIVRGLVSVLFIFIFSHWNLTRLAVAIFFLGVQVLHMSLVTIMVAKWQTVRASKRPIKLGEPVIMADGGHMYPTMPAQGHGTARREGYYQPQNGYNTYAGKEGTIYRSPPPSNNPYGTYGGRSTMGGL